MELTKYELYKLSVYADVYRNDCERKIRRIRRNRELLISRFNEIPSFHAEENGIFHPDIEIDILKDGKAEAVIIKKKLSLIKK